MKYSEVFGALANGQAIKRAGWDDKWLILVPASSVVVESSRPLGKALPDLVGRTVMYQAHIDIVTITPSGELWMAPWGPDSTILAGDWEVVKVNDIKLAEGGLGNASTTP